MITSEELRDLWIDEALDIIQVDFSPDDHGYWTHMVFKHDGSYYLADFLNENDGDYITIRDDPQNVEIKKVYPVTKISTVYVESLMKNPGDSILVESSDHMFMDYPISKEKVVVRPGWNGYFSEYFEGEELDEGFEVKEMWVAR